MDRRAFWALGFAVVLLAYSVRDLYVAHAQLTSPFAGDAGAYVRYGQHILEGYFGTGSEPDAHRPPGYPTLIAMALALGGDSYGRLLQWQVLMGAATVGLTIALGRRWLPEWGALLAGLLLALWPHHITFSAEVLSEVLYGFVLTAALLAASTAKRRAWVWLCTGLLFAAAAMVNTVAVLVPLVTGAALIGRESPQRWIALISPVVLIVGCWSLRPVEGGTDRIWINLVQGSHPAYHESWRGQGDVAKSIEAEARAAAANPAEGIAAIAPRIAANPGRYAAWYAAKPWHLWSWDIRISAPGGPYARPVSGSLLDTQPLRLTSAVLRRMNPAIFVAALLAAILALRRPGPAASIALTMFYVTAVHLVLQAEPRFSIPYRSIELLLAVSAACWAVAWFRLARVSSDRLASKSSGRSRIAH